ncbi:MAG: hypothetical protein JNM39_02680 [Bdellovibrionaceae bacterium]|nr:hypothetical protein [Pseudobdellovibrionaceae bacterium]
MTVLRLAPVAATASPMKAGPRLLMNSMICKDNGDILVAAISSFILASSANFCFLFLHGLEKELQAVDDLFRDPLKLGKSVKIPTSTLGVLFVRAWTRPAKAQSTHTN